MSSVACIHDLSTVRTYVRNSLSSPMIFFLLKWQHMQGSYEALICFVYNLNNTIF